jgi:hypothetical protein
MKLHTRATYRHRAAGLIVVCAALLAACTDGGRTPLVGADPSRQSSAIPEGAGAQTAEQKLARAFAGAMNDADVRAQVRNAMRASPYNEHKLVLQEFAGTRAGRRLIESAAQASGTTARELDGLIAQLPAMDFYAPFQAHRLAWRGGAEVVVGAAMDVDATVFTAYTPDGRTVSYRTLSGTPQAAWLFIHPAEPKSRRQSPQAATAGAVIQDPNDGTISYQIESCTTCLIEEPGDGTGGGGGGTGGGTMVLERFVSNVFDGIGAAELRFIVRDANQNEIAAHRFDGIMADWHAHRVVNYTFPRGAILHLREIDTWDSDDKGRFPIYALNSWVAAEEINCYFHYANEWGSYDAEHMCGPESYREQYWLKGPHWAAYLR